MIVLISMRGPYKRVKHHLVGTASTIFSLLRAVSPASGATSQFVPLKPPAPQA